MLRLLAAEMVKRRIVVGVAAETVRPHAKKNELQPWRKKCWCIPRERREARFVVTQMEEVLDVYTAEHAWG